jgi:hypothetical protein
MDIKKRNEEIKGCVGLIILMGLVFFIKGVVDGDINLNPPTRVIKIEVNER